MRFHVGPIPEDPNFRPESEGWIRLREPRPGLLMLVAIPLGMVLAVGLALLWSLVIEFELPADAFSVTITVPGLSGAVLALIAFMLAHELLHVVPAVLGGSSRHVVVGFWPRHAAPYVAYTGVLSRELQLLSGALPFVVLTVLPLVVALVFRATGYWMATLSVVNMLGSGADVMMVFLLARHVPRRAAIRNQGYSTWWRRTS